MKAWMWATALWLASWPALAMHSDGPVTRTDVAALVEQITAAVRSQDASVVIGAFTPDARITIVAPPALGGTMQLGLAEYRRMLIGGWRDLPAATYDVSNVVIELAADGRSATVTSTVREQLDLFGRELDSTTSQRMTVVSRGGRPRIAVLHGVMRVKGL